MDPSHADSGVKFINKNLYVEITLFQAHWTHGDARNYEERTHNSSVGIL